MLNHRRPTAWAGLLLVLTGTLLVGAGPAQAAPEKAPDRLVRVGTEGTYPPFTYRDPKTQRLTGYDVDVMRAVARQAGWRVRFDQAQFDAIFPALDARRIDAIANQITATPERRARYLFSTPYTYSRGVIVTAADTDDITTLKDLRGKTTAQSETSNWATIARDAGAKVQSVEGFAQTAELLQQGRIDATVNDNIAVLDYLASTKNKRIKIAGYASDEVSAQSLAFRKSDPDLRRQADRALAELRQDGTLARISKKYFGTDVSVKASAQGKLDVRASSGSRSTLQVVLDTLGPMALGVVKGTVPLTVICFAVGLVLALAAALAQLSGRRWLTAPSRFYISVIRGTPLLVQLFIVFYGLPQIGVKLPGFVAACLALSLNVGGYAAEVIRASILSVPRGQFEAATTIGMDYAQSLRRIVLPQALRIAVPPLSNTLLSLVKDTSLVSVVLVTELFREAQNAASVSTEYLPLYAVAAAYFWVICFVISLGQKRLEGRLRRFAT